MAWYRILIYPIVFITILWGYNFCIGYISERTEDKYTRNLKFYHNWHYDRYEHISATFHSGDTLSFIYKTFWQEVDPFHKWYISDVGMVKPWSKLSKKLDSLVEKERGDTKYKLE